MEVINCTGSKGSSRISLWTQPVMDDDSQASCGHQGRYPDKDRSSDLMGLHHLAPLPGGCLTLWQQLSSRLSAARFGTQWGERRHRKVHFCWNHLQEREQLLPLRETFMNRGKHTFWSFCSYVCLLYTPSFLNKSRHVFPKDKHVENLFSWSRR